MEAACWDTSRMGHLSVGYSAGEPALCRKRQETVKGPYAEASYGEAVTAR